MVPGLKANPNRYKPQYLLRGGQGFRYSLHSVHALDPETLMTHFLAATRVALLMSITAFAWSAESDDTIGALDAFWSEVSRTVAQGDFEAYAATYHPDAVLVSAARDTSYPIAMALAGWRQGFDDTANGKTQASVEFRFTKRMHDDSTAHETGIFHYTAMSEDGAAVDQYLHFEALLVRKDEWQLVMEFQKEPATAKEWAAAE